MTKGRDGRGRFAGRKVHVIGLGAWGTGREVARALQARGAEVTVSDVKPAGELGDQVEALRALGITVHAGGDAYRGIEQADLIVPSPGVPLDIPPLLAARGRGAEVVSEIEVAFWLARAPLIAVTGTKGKTTTTALIGELLKGAGRPALVGGNIGRPLIAIADEAGPEAVIVAEVSSFQLEGTKRFRPKVAVLLNLFSDHLDRHETMAAYREAKRRIFAKQEAEDIAIINQDDPGAWELRSGVSAELMPFTLERAAPEGADLVEGWLRVRGERVCPASALQLRGRHNLGNALAALAAAGAVGASLEKAAETIASFAGIEHRLESVGEVGGVLFVNDSQATTPAAAVAALESFSERVALIAGGRAKVPDFAELATAVVRRGASVVVIGEAGPRIAAAVRSAGGADVQSAENLPEATRLAWRKASPGGVVLLSPACASFDMFAGMAERGEVFRETVRALQQEERSN